MRALPVTVADHIDTLWQERYKPAFLQVDSEGRLLDWAGDCAYYGLHRLEANHSVSEQVPFLEGLLPFQNTEPLVLPLIDCASGRAAHVHILAMPDVNWVLFFDAEAEREQRRELQQRGHELDLLNHQKTCLIETLHQTQRALEIKHRQAEEASKIKSRFIANMSHELRVPLASILGYAQCLREGCGQNPEDFASIRGIQSNANHLLALIDNILDQAKIEAGQMLLLEGINHPARMLNDLRAMFAPIAQERALDLQMEQHSLPDAILTDGLRLRQVIINLVNNALKFTERGFVKFNLNWQAGMLEVTVKDSGPGIAPEARERIFQAFHQEAGKNSWHHPGVGLGLAISHHLVGLMGGELQMDSVPGQGAVFAFTVPAPEVETPAASAASIANKAAFSILVAEDNEALQALTAIYLEDAGYRVLKAKDGKEAVALALSEAPDLILMDMHMPVMDGYEAVTYLRKIGYQQPIIALTATLAKDDQGHAMAVGCDAYLVKPLETETLLAIVAGCLGG